jgi:hypothetical protein
VRDDPLGNRLLEDVTSEIHLGWQIVQKKLEEHSIYRE